MESIGVRMLKIWGSVLGESEIAVCRLHPDWDYRWSGIPPFDLHPERSGRYRGLQSQAQEDEEGKRYPSLGPSGTETDGQKYFLRTGVLQPQPEYLHAIVEHPDSGEWYILRCARHGLTFGRYPVKLAELHLRRSIHLTVPKGQSVFEAFGVRVLDCDEEKAQQNNDMAARAVLYDGYKPLLHLNHRERSREQNCPLGIENSPELESESEE